MQESNDFVTRGELRGVIRASVLETLVSLGVAANDPLEMQRDFQALRDWRYASSRIRTKAMVTMVSILVGGILAAIWIGVKSVFIK